MLHEFLHTNRLELTARCRAKVAGRASPAPAPAQLKFGNLESGVPVLIEQLVEMLVAEEQGQPSDPAAVRSIARSATQHGRDLLQRGFTVDQVVHDYGDLCQAVTELAEEQGEPISVGEFHTFNRCLDSAIADAVIEFGRRRDHVISTKGTQNLSELAHELRHLVDTVTLAYAAIKGGHGAIAGETGAVLDRSLVSLGDVADRVLAAASP
jgi:hypothetical protein